MSESEDMRKTDGGASDYEDDDECFKAKIFPQLLMEILADERNADCIAWLPHGRAFIIRNRVLFADKVMPKCFPRKAKYSSFTRKLNRWNFIRISSGPELGAYYHEFFLRDKPHLAAQMFCKNARTKLAMATMGEHPLAASIAAAASVAQAPPPQDESPPPTPNMTLPPHYLAAALQAKASLPTACDEQMIRQLLEQQKLIEFQMRIVQQAEPANRLLLQRAILKERAAEMQKMGVLVASTPVVPPPQQNNLVATTLALQQSQARLLQMREVLTMRYRQSGGNKRRSPTNNRASAA